MTTTVLPVCPSCGASMPRRSRGKTGLCPRCAIAAREPLPAQGPWKAQNNATAQARGLERPQSGPGAGRGPKTDAARAGSANGYGKSSSYQAVHGAEAIPPCPHHQDRRHRYDLPTPIPPGGFTAACACGRWRRYDPVESPR